MEVNSKSPRDLFPSILECIQDESRKKMKKYGCDRVKIYINWKDLQSKRPLSLNFNSGMTKRAINESVINGA